MGQAATSSCDADGDHNTEQQNQPVVDDSEWERVSSAVTTADGVKIKVNADDTDDADADDSDMLLLQQQQKQECRSYRRNRKKSKKLQKKQQKRDKQRECSVRRQRRRGGIESESSSSVTTTTDADEEEEEQSELLAVASSSPLSEETMRVGVNVVCFHGRGQTIDSFSRVLKSFEKKAKARKLPWSFRYRQGFYPVPEGGYGWYDDHDTGTGDGADERRLLWSTTANHHHHHSRHHQVMKERCYRELIRISNSSDIGTPILLVGFSEGASFVLDLVHSYQGDPDCPFIGAVVISPPSLRHFPNDQVIDPCTSIPIALICSLRDRQVSARQSLKWCKWFPEAEVISSDLGHKIPFQRSQIRNRIFEMFNFEYVTRV